MKMIDGWKKKTLGRFRVHNGAPHQERHDDRQNTSVIHRAKRCIGAQTCDEAFDQGSVGRSLNPLHGNVAVYYRNGMWIVESWVWRKSLCRTV
jgi:hypothetical protein